jgi:hypothetical protein
MPTVPRDSLTVRYRLALPSPPHYAFPNLIGSNVPPDFQLWPDPLSVTEPGAAEPLGITLPVTPVIPPAVASGDLITASHENAVRQALNDLWIDVQALGSKAVNDPTTAKGQILVRGASAVEAMPAGVNGQVLVADSSQAQGLRWTNSGSLQTPWLQNIDGGGFTLSNAVLSPAMKGAAQTPWLQNIDGGGFTLSNAVLSPAMKGAAQTPWLQNIDGANYVLNNVAKIGIGTVSLARTFQVRPVANINFGITASATDLLIESFNDAVSANMPMFFYASKFSFGGGNVGIGMTSPSVPLGFAMATGRKIGLYDNPVNWFGFGIAPNELQYEVPLIAGHVFLRGGVELMRIGGTDADVRIANNLEVTADIRIGNSSPTTAVQMRLDGYADTLYLATQGGAGGKVALMTNGITRLQINEDGSPFLWLGGSLKLLTVDGSGFVKAA